MPEAWSVRNRDVELVWICLTIHSTISLRSELDKYDGARSVVGSLFSCCRRIYKVWLMPDISLFIAIVNNCYFPYASTTFSITHSGTNIASSSSSVCNSNLSSSPCNLRCRIFAHSCLVNVELTCRYFGSPSKNIVRRGHTNGPSNSGPHEFSICNCRSSCPSADQVRIPRKKMVAFWVLAYLHM